MFGKKKNDAASAAQGASAQGTPTGSTAADVPQGGGGPVAGPTTTAMGIVKRHDDLGGQPVLSFTDVDVKFDTEFGQVHAVKGVTFDVRPGEVVALVGESGSGKSVTSATAMGLLPSNADITGSVQLAGREVLDMTPGQLRGIRGDEVAYGFDAAKLNGNSGAAFADQLTHSE